MGIVFHNLHIMILLIFIGLVGCSKEQAAKLISGSAASGLTEIQLPAIVDVAVGETLSFSDGEAEATLVEIGIKQDYCPAYSHIIFDCSVELNKPSVLVRIKSIYGANVLVPLVLQETVTSSWGFSMTLNSVNENSANITISK